MPPPDCRAGVAADLSVIIPTLGRPILQRCLQAIANGTVRPATIITIDQGQNLAVADWLLELQAMQLETVHLRSTEKGPASARNAGLRQVHTPFVAAIDDDCVAERDWLEKLVNQLHQNPEAIITGRVEPAGEGGLAPTIVTSQVPRVYRHPSVRFPSPLTTGNMGCALHIAQAVGPFDENLFTAEDNDWAYRALRAGIPILYTPEVVVYHFHWRDKLQLVATYRAYAWGQGAFYGKHLRQGDWSMASRTALSLFRGFRNLFYGVTRHDYARRVNGFSRITLLIPGLIAGLRIAAPHE